MMRLNCILHKRLIIDYIKELLSYLCPFLKQFDMIGI